MTRSDAQNLDESMGYGSQAAEEVPPVEFCDDWFRAECRRARARFVRAEDGTLEVRGKLGSIYVVAPGVLGMAFVLPREEWRDNDKRWAYVKKGGLTLGMKRWQDGDTEGVLTFEGTPEQWQFALKKIKHRRSPRYSEDELARRRERGRNLRVRDEEAA